MASRLDRKREPTMPTAIDRTLVESILAEMSDPETGRNIVQMGQVYDVDIVEQRVVVTLGSDDVVRAALGRISSRVPSIARTKAAARKRHPRANRRTCSAGGKDRPDRPDGQERDRRRIGQRGRRQEHDRGLARVRAEECRCEGRPDGCRRVWAQHSAPAGRQRAADAGRRASCSRSCATDCG